MNLDLRPVRVATGSNDQEGILAFVNEQLVAVLVRLSDLHHDLAGCWYLEAGFGIRDADLIFRDLDSVRAWLSRVSREVRHLPEGNSPT
jgi:hypothetical protein